MATVLIVDDDENFASGMAEFLRLSAHKPVLVGTIAEAREALERHRPALVVLDLMLPDGNGLELLEAAADDTECQVVITTGHEGISRFIGALEGRNISYLTKPVDPKALLGILNAAQAEQDCDDAIPGAEPHFGLIIGQSPAMLRVCGKIRQVAPMDCTVFIRGESGTGKELVAEAIHRASHRSGAYVPVNCGGLPRSW
jgi:DNA-binding NtrC family response regulator